MLGKRIYIALIAGLALASAKIVDPSSKQTFNIKSDTVNLHALNHNVQQQKVQDANAIIKEQRQLKEVQSPQTSQLFERFHVQGNNSRPSSKAITSGSDKSNEQKKQKSQKYFNKNSVDSIHKISQQKIQKQNKNSKIILVNKQQTSKSIKNIQELGTIDTQVETKKKQINENQKKPVTNIKTAVITRTIKLPSTLSKISSSNNRKKVISHITKFNEQNKVNQPNNFEGLHSQLKQKKMKVNLRTNKPLLFIDFQSPKISQTQASKSPNTFSLIPEQIQIHAGQTQPFTTSQHAILHPFRVPSIQKSLTNLQRNRNYKIQFEWWPQDKNCIKQGKGQLLVFWNHRLVGSYSQIQHDSKGINKQVLHLRSLDCQGGHNLIKFMVEKDSCAVAIDNISIYL